MTTIKDNFLADKDYIQTLIKNDSKNHPVPVLANAESEIKGMEATVKQVETDIPKVMEVQQELNNEGQDELN